MAESTEIAVRNRDMQRRAQQRQGRPTYILRPVPRSGGTAPPPPPSRTGNDYEYTPSGKPNRIFLRVPDNKTTNTGPRFLSSQRTILFAWVVAIAFVCADEWKAFGILPRPSRLWWTSLVYGILAIISQVEALIPLANALALGYTTVLVWQYFNREGQFSGQ